MAYLRKRKRDGVWIIKANPYHDGVKTYQTTAESIRYLQRYDICQDGQEFSNSFLFDLLRLNIIYINDEVQPDAHWVHQPGTDDFEHRKNESDLEDRPPLRDLPRHCLLENASGELQVHIVVPPVSPKWLRQASRQEMSLFSSPRCQFKIGGTSVAADMLRYEPYAIPIVPSPLEDLSATLAGKWPETLDTTALTFTLDRLGDQELFADPSIGGKRLFQPRLAPGDSVFPLARHDNRPHDELARVLTQLQCSLESNIRIASWDVYRVTLPSNDGIWYEEALKALGARRALARWRLRVIAPPALRYDAEHRATFQSGRGLVLRVSVRAIESFPASRYSATIKLYRGIAESHHLPVSLIHDETACFALPPLEPGQWTLAIGDRALGWDRQAFLVTADMPDIPAERQRLSARILLPDRVVELDGLDDPVYADVLDRAAIAGLDLEIDKPVSARIDLWAAEPGGKLRPHGVALTCDQLAGELRAQLAGGKRVSLTLDSGRFGRIGIDLSPRPAFASHESRQTTERHAPPVWHQTLNTAFAKRGARRIAQWQETRAPIPVTFAPVRQMLRMRKTGDTE